MAVYRFTIALATEGNAQIINLQPEIARKLQEVSATAPGIAKGPAMLSLFVVGSTAALTTLEFEVGLVKHDLPALLQKLVPDDARYEHEATWHDDNGHSHLRAALLGPSLSVPLQDGRMMTGEYQQVVLVELDTRPRKRTIIGTIYM
ncbi:secondary thiamine-phosphate synthase enzyme YjbQ [Humisphaera borealis]|uniref:YjbQ family protein n=1 Tax=Humisphaera borealis TaxID=2807512 RepID=A0A7M2WTH4_9BACT|nr:secondary thiamine-phosphate synthase enzyme YjbQ [Humisphaera borealis]QOV88776.1 YjbQ family protein [Humisphaera borealis]